ncbi:hypothetical protein K7432_015989, partial [Basidiobolus ranarum]
MGVRFQAIKINFVNQSKEDTLNQVEILNLSEGQLRVSRQSQVNWTDQILHPSGSDASPTD